MGHLGFGLISMQRLSLKQRRWVTILRTRSTRVGDIEEVTADPWRYGTVLWNKAYACVKAAAEDMEARSIERFDMGGNTAAFRVDIGGGKTEWFVTFDSPDADEVVEDGQRVDHQSNEDIADVLYCVASAINHKPNGVSYIVRPQYSMFSVPFDTARHIEKYTTKHTVSELAKAKVVKYSMKRFQSPVDILEDRLRALSVASGVTGVIGVTYIVSNKGHESFSIIGRVESRGDRTRYTAAELLYEVAELLPTVDLYELAASAEITLKTPHVAKTNNNIGYSVSGIIY